MKRAAAVSGQFYHASRERLTQQVEQYIDGNAEKEKAVAIIVPHAGLIYSGAVAGATYSAIRFPRTFILLGPNHTGLGSPVALMDEGEWEIPTASFEVDRKLAGRIAKNSPGVTRDARAHLFEHSLEVQLPFIGYFSDEVKIVPISFMKVSLDDCRYVATGIADAVRSVDYSVVIAASSDMSHYLPDKTARHLDSKAIQRILEMDPEGLYQTVRSEGISMCGYLPTTVALLAARELGADSARLVKYMTSGDVSGDYDSVVGYAGIVIR